MEINAEIRSAKAMEMARRAPEPLGNTAVAGVLFI